MNPSDVPIPSFLMSAPFGYTAATANNIWMVETPDREVNLERAFAQWLELKRILDGSGLVHLLPVPLNVGHRLSANPAYEFVQEEANTTGDADGPVVGVPCEMQDLTFVANIGCVLHHVEEPTVVLSHFQSEPRKGEEAVGALFFAGLGYRVVYLDTTFEGEADLKHLQGNVYLGGYGQRTHVGTHAWLAEEHGCEIIKLRMTDDHAYHLDCTVFPLTADETVVCTEVYDQDEVKAIEQVTDILDVSLDDAYQGVTNSVRVGNTIVNASNINDLKRGTDLYRDEVHKNRVLEDIASERGFEVVAPNLSEFLKAGALLSCLVMHLNRQSYSVPLLA